MTRHEGTHSHCTSANLADVGIEREVRNHHHDFARRGRGFLLLLVASLTPLFSQAYTAIAQVDGTPRGTIYAAWGYATQKEADLAAVKGCRAYAKESGLTKKSANCAVIHRQKGFGGGAMVCGVGGCAMSTGVDTQQNAVDRAFRQCEQKKLGDCQTTDITSWWDETGYGQPSTPKREAKSNCGPPPGRTVRSTYQCSNGDCVRTFENGCAQRFQAPYCHDPISGKWDWKPDGC